MCESESSILKESAKETDRKREREIETKGDRETERERDRERERCSQGSCMRVRVCVR